MLSNAVKMEHVSCANCNSDRTKKVLVGHDRLHGLPGEFTVVKCTQCSLMYVNPRPTSESIGSFYPDDYGPYMGTQSAVQRQPSDTTAQVSSVVSRPETIVSRFRYRWRLFEKQLREQGETELPEYPKPGKVLEIGCASGGFLAQLKAKGWDCYGVDLGESPIRYAREQLQLNASVSTVEEMIFEDGTFDLVVGWMVLEHLHDPVAGLKKISDVLKPGGYFAFSIPNAGSWELKVFKSKWYALHLPCHLYHYDLVTLTNLLQKSGFTVEKVIYQKNVNNIIGSFWHFFEDLTGQSRLTFLFRKWAKSNPTWLLLIMRPFALAMCALKQGGRITVWTKKAGRQTNY